MKKAIFFVGLLFICLISCTSSKKSTCDTDVKSYYKTNSYAEDYLDAPGLITPCQASIYMNAFPKHTYKHLRRSRLDTAWSTFNRPTLNKLVTDGRIDSIFFFLAAFPKKDKSVLKDSIRHPFIILQAVPKRASAKNENGISDSIKSFSNSLYFAPVLICPPPNSGCRVSGS